MASIDFRDVTSRRTAPLFLSPSTLAIIICAVLAAALSLDRTLEVWRTGAFFDTDDATRAVQLRAWLAGQGWYDLAIHRLDPPAGLFMHWSRIVDVPLAALTLLARPFLDPQMAERFARIAFPFLCFVSLLAAAGSAASALGGVRARLAGVILCFLGAPFLGQFIPGRIDHHAPQILLLVLMTGATLRAFDPAQSRQAALAGLFAALSLSISLENLPFVAIVAGSFPLLFVAGGVALRPALLWFAGGFASACVALFIATVGPMHRGEAVCDAFSLAHLVPALVGCAALAALAFAAPRLATSRSHAVAVALCAPLPIIAAWLVAPNCLGDPFVGLDPLVRDVWLRHVGEVEPLPSFLRTHVFAALTMLVPMLCAGVLAIIGSIRGHGIARARMALLAALLVTATAMTLWGIRAFSSGLPLVAVVGAPFLAHLAQRARTLGARAGVALAAVPFAPLALALLLPADAPVQTDSDTLACVTPHALAAVAALPPGAILAPIDAGAHLLAFTPHAVFAAPYHRNNVGNRLAIDALSASPDVARNIVTQSGATYVALCAGEDQVRIIAERAPDGLAARLVAGVVPDWLVPVSTGAQKVFRVGR